MDMDMGMSSTTTPASATPTGAMNHDMGMGMGPAGMCKISMLWNWNVMDTCFISKSWQITSKGMFAGSCIGVVLLVIALEFLRRLSKEYDRFLIKQHAAKFRDASAPAVVTATAANTAVKAGGESVNSQDVTRAAGNAMPPFRPNVLQQAARALLHMVQFAIAYFVMLLAMYYNGYFIICIFIGAYIGAFVFQWETLSTALIILVLQTTLPSVAVKGWIAAFPRADLDDKQQGTHLMGVGMVCLWKMVMVDQGGQR